MFEMQHDHCLGTCKTVVQESDKCAQVTSSSKRCLSGDDVSDRWKKTSNARRGLAKADEVVKSVFVSIYSRPELLNWKRSSKRRELRVPR